MIAREPAIVRLNRKPESGSGPDAGDRAEAEPRTDSAQRVAELKAPPFRPGGEIRLVRFALGTLSPADRLPCFSYASDN